MKALEHHHIEKSIMLYVERWLTAPMQHADGTIRLRTRGAPQGGVISPVLSNLFLHYVFDAWMERTFCELPFCRYADDAVVHCRTFGEAERVLAALTSRLEECGLAIHPDKTHIVCCKPGMRRNSRTKYEFTFLGYTFKPRCCQWAGTNKVFTGFVPAMSASSEKSVRASMQSMPFVLQRSLSLQQVAAQSRPYIQGWMNYYCKFSKSQFRRVAAYFNALLVRWAMCKFKRFRGKRGRAQVWLASMAKSNPELFPHWKPGWTRMIG